MKKHITYIAKTNHRRKRVRFGIKQHDRRQHIYILGKTGTGKSTLIRNLIIQDIHRGHGVGVIDPHGDLAESLLDVIPTHRTNDVVYLNPSDPTFSVGFNVLHMVEDSALATSAVVSAFKTIWGSSWGPRLEHLLYALVASLAEVKGTTLLSLARLLNDEHYRHHIASQVADPVLKVFWKREYPTLLTDAFASIQNKVGQLLTKSALRHCLGQKRAKFSPQITMERGSIVLANLSKGAMGEDASNLLGALLVSGFQVGAMARANVPEENRRDFYLYIDEFQNFTTSSFETILSEARRFKLSLTISHQFVDQVPHSLRRAVFGNVGTMISFRLGYADAVVLSHEFGGVFAPDDFTNLGRFDIYLRLLIDGVQSEAFSSTTLPPSTVFSGRREQVVKATQERFGTRRSVIESQINRALR